MGQNNIYAVLAQLVERLNGIQKVRSSTLLTSTIKKEPKMGKGEQSSPFLLFFGGAEMLDRGVAGGVSYEWLRAGLAALVKS